MLAAIGGGTLFATTRRPSTALAPWDAAGTYGDPRMNALSWAILAPNPHNRQPWLAELRGDDQIAIWRDKSLNLPETDPFDRQLTIGMGCFLEVLRLAAAEQGISAQSTLFPEGEGGPVATVVLAGSAAPDPLFAQVPLRHTNRQAYDDRLPDPAALEAMALESSALITDPAVVQDLRALTWDAMRIEMATHRTHMESVELMRFGKREINADPDGITLGGPFLEALMAVGMLTREGQADPESGEYQQTLATLKAAMDATPAYATVTTSGNSREDQIEAGRKWVRLHLAATAQGISMQPLSQALQEYPEQAELYQRVHQMLAEPGETVQMLGRIGYGPKVGPSPRWPLERRMMDA